MGKRPQPSPACRQLSSLTIAQLLTTAGSWDASETEYDDFGDATTTIDGANSGTPRITTSLFDAFGDMTATIDPLGRTSADAVDLDGETTVTTDPAGRQTFELMNAFGEVTATISDVPSGNTLTIDQLLTTAGSWDVTLSEYDADGNVTGTIDGANLTSSFWRITTSLVDADGDVTTSIDALGQQTYYLMDEYGEVTATISGVPETNTLTVNQLLTTAGSWDVTKTEYDASGNATETIDGANLTSGERITTTMFDEFGDPVETIDPMGRVSTNVVDLDGETVKSVDPLGNQTFDVYDGDGEVTIAVTGVPESVTASVATLISTTGTWDVTDDFYDSAGNQTESVDGANLATSLWRVSKTSFDEFGDATMTTDPMGRVTTSLVDLDGETTKTIDPLGNKTYNVYDSDGEVTIAVTGVPASVTASVATLIGTTGTWDVTDDFYDASGNVTETIDGVNLTTSLKRTTKPSSTSSATQPK